MTFSPPARTRNTEGRLTLGRVCLTCGLLAVALAGAGALALHFGSAGELWRVLFGGSPATPQERVILLELRLPRVILAMLVGAALATAGACFQSLLRNPLADPYVLGISSGAALGTILTLLLAGGDTVAAPLAAFGGALAAAGVVYALGYRRGQFSGYSLLLAGMVTASFLSAIIVFLSTTLSGSDLRGLAFWLMGDLSLFPGFPLSVVALPILAGLVVVYRFAPDLNLLLLGEDEAARLGVNLKLVKTVIYVCAALLTGLSVSVAGAVGFLGLLVPHLARQLFGSDYRLLLPAGALCGAILLVAADTLARTAIAPAELPVGAFTAMAGAPLFVYLLRRRTPS